MYTPCSWVRNWSRIFVKIPTFLPLNEHLFVEAEEENVIKTDPSKRPISACRVESNANFIVKKLVVEAKPYAEQIDPHNST